mmetsp:Transcript_18936/g.54570  ORF Transcript_18936/g.54570 Transcript_18936/m.54570 type:complete len:296 (-) Transcript_18936:51-938(-)
MQFVDLDLLRLQREKKIVSSSPPIFLACILLYQQNGIYTSIQLGIVGNLRHFPPSNFAARRYEAQFAHIYFNNGTLGQNTEVGVETAAGILLHAKNIQLEGCLQFWMRAVAFLHAQAGRSDEALVLGSLPGEVIAHESGLGYHTFPGLPTLGTCPHHLEHLVVGHRLDLGDRHLPLPGLLFALLLDGVAQDLGAADALPIEQVRRDGALGDSVVVGVLVRPLVVLGDRLAHGGLLLEPPLVVQLGPDSVDLLGELGPLVRQPGLPLPLPLLGVEPTAVHLAVPLHVFVLRHGRNS